MVVDDNQLTLPGYVAALRSSPAIEVVGAFGHGDALAWPGDWSDVGVVVVDAADESAAGDQFPGVGVVRHVRAATAASALRPVVVVVTGHYLHDGLRHRMAEADADFFFLRSELRSPEALLDVVLHPERFRRGVVPVADDGSGRALGLGPEADIEAFLGYVEAHGLGPSLDPDASRPDRRSRRWLRHREGMTAAGGIEPVNLTTGDRPRDQDIPSIRQLSRLWAWAARIRRPDDRA